MPTPIQKRRFPGSRSRNVCWKSHELAHRSPAQAEVDLLVARDWYEQQDPGLRIAFAHSVDEILDRIVMPEMYAVVFKEVRRAKLRRFPYLVYYRVRSDRIEVIAVLHGRRDPKLWQERVN